jgi:hypothetical protein
MAAGAPAPWPLMRFAPCPLSPTGRLDLTPGGAAGRHLLPTPRRPAPAQGRGLPLGGPPIEFWPLALPLAPLPSKAHPGPSQGLPGCGEDCVGWPEWPRKPHESGAGGGVAPHAEGGHWGPGVSTSVHNFCCPCQGLAFNIVHWCSPQVSQSHRLGCGGACGGPPGQLWGSPSQPEEDKGK